MFSRLFAVTVSLFVFSACTHKSDNIQRDPQSTQELIDGSAQILAQLRDPNQFNSKTCVPFIKQSIGYVYDLPSTYFTPKNPSEVGALRNRGSEVIDNMWSARLQIFKRLGEFEAEGGVAPECLAAIRKSLVYLRFAEEMLTEWMVVQGIYSFKKSHNPFDNGFPFVVVNPAFGKVEIKSGDVFVVRGSSEVSATIARLSDIETQMSHLAIAVYSPEGELYVIESLIQTGTLVWKWQDWLKDQEADGRIALYRHPDARLAQAAADAIFKKLYPLAQRKSSIPYDFTMNDGDPTTLYCAETVSYAYKLGSNGQFKIPLHRSTLVNFKGTEILENFGLLDRRGKPLETIFAPTDVEVDTRFEWVADFHNYPYSRQVRMQDAVLSSLNEWAMQKGYKYRAPLNVRAQARIAKILRWATGKYADSFPKEMPQGFLKMFMQIRAAARILETNLYKKEEEFYKRTGHSLTYKEMLALNEEYRKADCKAAATKFKQAGHQPGIFDDPENAPFHLFFNPGNKPCDP